MARLSGTTTKSFRDAAARIKAFSTVLQQGAGSGLLKIGNEIMTDIKASAPGHGVPRDTGTLAGTGAVEKVNAVEVELSFGGAAAPYALTQHERMDYHHKLGEPRYLVRGIERWQPDGSAAMEALKANAEAGLKAVAQK